MLPGWSAIMSRYMEKGPWPLEGVGEVQGTNRVTTLQSAPPSLTGAHLCGTTQDFAEGGEYLPDDPPAEYDAQGYLACCEVAPIPPPDVPVQLSNTCAASPVVQLDTWYAGNFLLQSNLPWWSLCIVPVPGAVYHIEWEPLVSGPFEGYLAYGSDCSSGVFFVLPMPVPGCYTFPILPGAYWRPTWFADVFPPVAATVRFRIRAGACE